VKVRDRNGLLQAGEVCAGGVSLQQSSGHQPVQLDATLYHCCGAFYFLSLDFSLFFFVFFPFTSAKL